MNDKRSTVVMALIAFAATFGGAFLVLGLGQALPGILAVAPGSWHLSADPATLGPITTSVPSTFHKVKASDIKTGEAASAEAERVERENAVVGAKFSVKVAGLGIPEDLIRASYDDSPDAAGYAAYAQRDQVLYYTDQDRDNGEERDMKVACFAIRKPDGKGTEHWVIKYSDSKMGGDETAELWAWVLSGCAQSVHDNATTLSPAALNVTMLGLMPKTADYAERRRRWQAHLTPGSDGR